MLILGCDRELAYWAAQRLKVDFSHSPFRAIGVSRNDRIVAVALYNNYRHPNIEVSFVASTPKWASRQTICGILRYPFCQLKCRRITAVTEECNDHARKFLVWLGFELEGQHPDLFMSGSGISYGLRLDRARRWIGSEN